MSSVCVPDNGMQPASAPSAHTTQMARLEDVLSGLGDDLKHPIALHRGQLRFGKMLAKGGQAEVRVFTTRVPADTLLHAYYR